MGDAAESAASEGQSDSREPGYGAGEETKSLGWMDGEAGVLTCPNTHN